MKVLDLNQESQASWFFRNKTIRVSTKKEMLSEGIPR